MVTGKMSENTRADGGRWIEVVVIISVSSLVNAPNFLSGEEGIEFWKVRKIFSILIKSERMNFLKHLI